MLQVGGLAYPDTEAASRGGRPGRVVARTATEAWLLGIGGGQSIEKVVLADAAPAAWPWPTESLLGAMQVVGAVQQHLGTLVLQLRRPTAAAAWLALLSLRTCATALDAPSAAAADISAAVVDSDLLTPLMTCAAAAGVNGPMNEAELALEPKRVELLQKVRAIAKAGGKTYAYETAATSGDGGPDTDMSYLDSIVLDQEWDPANKPLLQDLQLLAKPELADDKRKEDFRLAR